MRSVHSCILISYSVCLCLAQTPSTPPVKRPSPPSVISKSDPQYSEEARRARVESSVMLGIVVNTNGAAEDIRVINGSGFGLDERAIESVTQWRFNPGAMNGTPVKVRAQVEVNFRLIPRAGRPPLSLPRTRLNFKLPPGAARPQLISGAIPEDLPMSPGQNVNLSLQVDAAGAIAGINVLNSTDPDWESRVRKALDQWKFSPATENGQPLAVEGILDVSSPPAPRPRPPANPVQ